MAQYAKYVVCGRENGSEKMERHTCRASSTSIPSSHLNRLRRFTQLLIGKQMRGTVDQAAEYCKKKVIGSRQELSLLINRKRVNAENQLSQNVGLLLKLRIRTAPSENLKIYKFIHSMYRSVEDRDVLDNVGFVVLVAAEK